VSYSDTSWKTVLATGPHLAVTPRRRTTLSAAEARREEARGCWACAEWAALALGRCKKEKGGRGNTHAAGGETGPRSTWAREKKKGGRFWAFGPKIERESLSLFRPKIERESLSLFIFCFSFLLKTNLFHTFSKPTLNSFLMFSQNHSSQ